MQNVLKCSATYATARNFPIRSLPVVSRLNETTTKIKSTSPPFLRLLSTTNWLNNKMEKQSDLWQITDPPNDPIDLFNKFINEYVECTKASVVTMNLASRNDEFGVANRYMIYRGLKSSDVCFVTGKNSRKYTEMKEDPRVAVTFLIGFNAGANSVSRQIRINGRAVEFLEDEVRPLWEEESVMAKIRSHICISGKPVVWEELKSRHDELLRRYEGGEELKQPESYSAFRIIAETMDFYEACQNTIADRILYKRCGKSWTKERISA